MVGARGFEPPTTCAPCRCAIQAAPRPDNIILLYKILLVNLLCLICGSYLCMEDGVEVEQKWRITPTKLVWALLLLDMNRRMMYTSFEITLN